MFWIEMNQSLNQSSPSTICFWTSASILICFGRLLLFLFPRYDLRCIRVFVDLSSLHPAIVPHNTISVQLLVVSRIHLFLFLSLVWYGMSNICLSFERWVTVIVSTDSLKVHVSHTYIRTSKIHWFEL